MLYPDIRLAIPQGPRFDHFTRKNMCFTSKVIDFNTLCKLYSNLPLPIRNEFFRKWIKHCCEDDFVCYDITSISKYSPRLPFVAWGYNRDKEQLPQFNVGMFCTVKSGKPVFFYQYNSNINDFTNFPYVAQQAKEVGLDNAAKMTLVIDGGFAVPDTIVETVDCWFELIVRAPSDFGVKIKDNLLLWRNSPMQAEEKVILSDTKAVSYSEQPFSFGKVNSRLLMYKTTSSASAQEFSLVTLINRMKAELQERKHISCSGQKSTCRFLNLTFMMTEASVSNLISRSCIRLCSYADALPYFAPEMTLIASRYFLLPFQGLCGKSFRRT